MNPIATTLFDRHQNTDVAATVRLGLTDAEVLAVEAVWGPVRRAAVQRLVQGGYPLHQMPQHWHWDWGRKVPKLALLAYTGVGVEVGGDCQGLMLLALVGHDARLPADLGRPLVYVDYVETAPWNLDPLDPNPRYSGVGKRLLTAAVQVSADEGFGGLIGLHSLPQAEGFYEQRCRLVRVGPDPHYAGLEYFESTRQRAQEILTGGAI